MKPVLMCVCVWGCMSVFLAVLWLCLWKCTFGDTWNWDMKAWGAIKVTDISVLGVTHGLRALPRAPELLANLHLGTALSWPVDAFAMCWVCLVQVGSRMIWLQCACSSSNFPKTFSSFLWSLNMKQNSWWEIKQRWISYFLVKLPSI